jgi:hypothetical protein
VNRICGLAVDSGLIKQLFDVRNGVVHSSFMGGIVGDQIFLEFIRASEELEQQFEGGAPEDIGGTWGPELADFRAKSNRQLQEVVQRKMDAAQKRVTIVLRGVSPTAVRETRAVLQAENARLAMLPVALPSEWGMNESLFLRETHAVRCPVPACRDENAMVTGWSAPGRDGEPRRFHVHQFRCGVCELHLINGPEAGAAAVPIFFDVQ